MDRTVTFVLGMLTAGAISLPLGFWLGGEMEQDEWVKIVEMADFSDQCQAEFARGVEAVLGDE